jgi:hypothetical protein
VLERHAGFLTEGAEIEIGDDTGGQTGRLVKLYPQIENGHVIADVEESDMDARFVNARVLVRLPVGETKGLVVPAAAIVTRMDALYSGEIDDKGLSLYLVSWAQTMRLGESQG